MYDKFTFEGMSEGDIYSYTPANGKVELVYPAQALRLKVTDEGIFYLKGKLDKNEKYNATGLEWYYIPFGGSEPQSIESGRMYDVWNGYQYDWSGDNLRLKSEVTGDVIEVVTDSEYRYTRSYIFKNKIFSLNVFSTECFDLLTREEVFSYNLWESVSATDWTSGLETSKRQGVARFLKQLIEKGNIQSKRFALTEDSMLWFVLHNQFVYRINLETGETQLFYYKGKGIIAENSCLYTDGKNLYAIYYVGSIVGEEPVFARLFFEYDEKTGVWYWDVTDKIGVND